jgi:DNA-binding XRE family transcriptional regulator
MHSPINPQKRTWMQEARKTAGINSRDISEILGISYQHYNDIETGRRNPSIELSQVLADFFQVPIQKFFENRTKFKRAD